MTQDFRPEDMAALQRGLLSVGLVLLFIAGLVSFWTLRALALVRQTARARIPRRALVPAVAVASLLAIALVYRGLTAERIPERLAGSLTIELALPLLMSVCAALLALALGLRVLT